MKYLFLLFFFPASICFAQTPKKIYLTQAEVIALIQKYTPPPCKPDSTLFKDTDGDGVLDILDRQANTPKDCPVDTRGESTDSDGDGVIDCDDKEPYSLPGFPVDPNGVATRMTGMYDCGYLDVCGYRRNEWILPFLYFDKKSYCLKGQTQADLKNIGRILMKNSRLCVAIEGYTDDNFSSQAENAALSYHRAKAVADYLCANYGISADRLKIKIKGEENLIKGSRSEKNIDAYNRRVEIYAVDRTEVSDEAPKDADKVGKKCK